MTYYCGIDAGSSYTKAVLLDENRQIVRVASRKTGLSFDDACLQIFQTVTQENDAEEKAGIITCSTGVGRNNCSFAAQAKSELSCLAKAAFYVAQAACVIVDIGGQDNKIVHVSHSGQMLTFKMNRKCAAGTGSFVEEIALRLDLSARQMNDLAEQTDQIVEIGSYCTVFAGTEIIQHIRAGKNQHEIVRGVFASIVARVLEMDPLPGRVILSGGLIATHSVLATLFRTRVGGPVVVPDQPQLMGALGAALFAVA